MKPHKIIECKIYQEYSTQDKPVEVKKFTTIAFDDEDPEIKAEEYLQKRHGWKKGFHYNSIKIEVKEIVNNKQNIEMAKKTIATEATNETGVVLFEQQAGNINLPAIPKVITIGGLEFSEELIKKEVDEIKKLVMTEPKDTDTAPIIAERKKLYDFLKDSKNKFVKTRTAPENFRKEAVKPLNEWSKNLKAQTDAFGVLAKEGEEHCLTQMAILENWEAEQERLEREREEILIKERSQQLTDLGGVKNFESEHWTFPYALHIVVEKEQLASEFGWEETLKEITEYFDQHNKAKEAEEAKNKQIVESLFNARVMVLDMMQYQRSGDTFSKNGYTLSKEDILSLTDAGFQSKIQQHNITQDTQQQTGGFGGGFGGSFSNQKTETSSEPAPTNAFAQFAQTPTVSPSEPIKEEDTYEYYLATTQWTTPYVEKEMQATTIRVAPIENRESILAELSGFGKQIVYNEELGLGLFYVIFKK